MYRSHFIFTLIFLVSFCGHGQSNTYKNYKIEWDTLVKQSKVIDTLTQVVFFIEYGHQGYSRFRHGFIETRCGDMKGLSNLKGEKILDPSHFIRFNSKDSIISAYICNARAWIFLNFEGDTLSMSYQAPNNYVPSLTDTLNPELYINKGGTLAVYGYLNHNAQWQIQPQFQAAMPFQNGMAKVKINNQWGAIDLRGNYVVIPQFKDQNFEIPTIN